MVYASVLILILVFLYLRGHGSYKKDTKMESVKPYSIFEIGTLQVYQFLYSHEAGSTQLPNRDIYWRDPASPQGHGPFSSIRAAVEHYKWTITNSRGHPVTHLEQAVAPVVRVDFVRKKRIQPDQV